MIYRLATLSIMGLMLIIIWTGETPYLHDFGEWFYQSRILVLQLTQPESVAAFQWATYPVPNTLAILVMAALGLVFPVMASAKLFLSLLLLGWYGVLQTFVHKVYPNGGSATLLFVLFSLVALSNFFWTGFVGYQLGLLLLTLFLSRFTPQMSALELAVFGVLIFFSHAMVFLVFVLLVLLEAALTRKHTDWLLALVPGGLLSVFFVVGRSLSSFSPPIADAAMAGWQEAVIYKLGYPLLLGPFKNLLQPDLSSLIDHLPWVYWAGVLANTLVVTGLGLFVLLTLWQGHSGKQQDADGSAPPYRSLRMTAWLLSIFFILAPHNFYGLINPAGRITVPLLLVSLLLVTHTPLKNWLTKLLRVTAPVILVFTLVTVMSYGILIHRAISPEYLVKGIQTQTKPPADSVLDFNAWVYAKARYRYFNIRIFSFAKQFDNVHAQRYESLAFRTALLINYQDPP